MASENKENIKKITELKKIRSELIKYFVVFVVVPIFLGPLLFIALESNLNNELSDYVSAFAFNYEIIIGAEITNTTAVTDGGKIIVGIFSLLYLVFFGFVAGIIMTSIEIRVLSKNIK